MQPFSLFFQDEAKEFLLRAITTALAEDGPDLTTNAVFGMDDMMQAVIVAKEDTLLAGLPLIPIVLEQTALLEPGIWEWRSSAEEGALLAKGTAVASIIGSARVLLRAERILLNFISHMSGIANLVSLYVKALEGTGVRLLDTRKTLPCLRYPEKYAVLIGGGHNHRKNLAELLMLKDNHIDAAGGIRPAVSQLRKAYGSDIPIEVECRTIQDVNEAVDSQVMRIMLDNMEPKALCEALEVIPQGIEVEISGGVTLENIRTLVTVDAKRKPDFVSVGRLTHSAPIADFSMYLTMNGQSAG